MTKRSHRTHSPLFKTKACLAAVKGEKILAELAHQFEVYAHQITNWRSQLLECASDIFEQDKLSQKRLH